MKLIDVTRQFNTEEKCLAYLEKMRWPNGVCCIACGSLKVKKLEVTAKPGKTRTRGKTRWLYQCLERPCLHQFTATAGTIMQATHLPLTKWFMAIALICEAKKGISALQVQRHIGGSYKTVWHLCHRIRAAMNDGESLLGSGGAVEIDETYIGPKVPRRGGPIRKREKDVVIGIRERGGKLRFLKAESAKAVEIRRIVEANVSKDVAAIYTDEHPIYPWALMYEYKGKHKTICHKATYVIGDTHTNTVENAFSLLKRGIVGTFHKVSIKHLARYLSEFSYRFNRREQQGRLFDGTLLNLLRGTGLPYKALTSEVG